MKYYLDQINAIKNSFGINILELASFLLINIPTVYEWIETADFLKLSKSNSKRIKEIYDFSLVWRKKNVGRLGMYLYRVVDNNHPILFSLLSEQNINKQAVNSLLDKISVLIKQDQEREVKHNQILKEHGFSEMSLEDMKKQLFNTVLSMY